jgi:hypothetical protein
MQAAQAVGQLVSAVVAVLGTAGYVIVLGAIVLWVRLREASFPKEVPISLASREELLVIGAQALAVWIVLAAALLLLASRLMGASLVDRRAAIADLILGLASTVVVLAVMEKTNWEIITFGGGLLGLAVIGVAISALALRPPFSVWLAALVPVAVGVGLPFVVSSLGDESDPVGTVGTAWVAFLLLLLLLPTLASLRAQRDANSAAIDRLEMERSDLTRESATAPAGASERLHVLNRLLASLRERRHAASARLWLRGTAAGVAGLVLLGGIAVASQFDKAKLFRTGVVSLNTGRCVQATYLSRNSSYVVLGDQQKFPPASDGNVLPNKVVAIPISEVREVQVRNPTARGIPMTSGACGEDVVVPKR